MSLREDMYAQDSIDLLQNSGLQFREHEEHGIEPLEFAELLMSSGNENKINKTKTSTILINAKKKWYNIQVYSHCS